jgi:predicted transcriptional regulator
MDYSSMHCVYPLSQEDLSIFNKLIFAERGRDIDQ